MHLSNPYNTKNCKTQIVTLNIDRGLEEKKHKILQALFDMVDKVPTFVDLIVPKQIRKIFSDVI